MPNNVTPEMIQAGMNELFFCEGLRDFPEDVLVLRIYLAMEKAKIIQKIARLDSSINQEQS